MAVLNDTTIRSALEKVGERFRSEREVEILLVGGAAGVLTGELPPSWTTADVDVIHCRLPKDRDAVFDVAAEVGRELSLPPSWLSEDVGLHVWTLPDDWMCRRVLVGRFNHLVVYAAGRLDLIIMKFIAHRERDLEHLSKMNITPNERAKVAEHFERLMVLRPDKATVIEMAKQYVEAWEEA